MNAKHTPGRWIAVGGWVEIDNDDVPDICTCTPSDFGHRADERKWSEVEANSRLIAAAPELLEALRDLMHWQVTNVECWSNPAYDNAHRAIAKATGEKA
jgi:hypothetical protein